MADASSKISLIIGATDEASSKLQGISETATKMGQTMTVVGGAIVGALGLALKSYDDSLKVQSQLTAALESTHGAAGLYIDDLNEQSAALQKMTTYSDEAIGSSQALLLTFTNVKGPVFQQATSAILDMSTALGQDLKSSTIQLGKALNDPIKGITALSRVGVSFTEQQKSVIEQLVKTGQSAKAQQVILDELNKEFGGSAAAQMNTFSGQLENLKNQFDDFMEVVGSKVLPVLSEFLTKYVKPIIEKLQDWITKNPELASKIILIAGAIGALLVVVGPLLIAFAAIATAVAAITGAMLLTAGIILGVIVALVALGVAIYEVVKHWDDIKAKTFEVWNSILTFFAGIWQSIKNAFNEAINSIKQFFVDSWQFIYDHTIGVWNGLSDSAKGWLKLLGVILTGGLLEIVFIIVNNWETIKTTTLAVWEAITQALAAAWLAISTLAAKVWAPIKQFFVDTMTEIKKVFSDLWNQIKSDAATIWDGIKSVVGAALDWISAQIQKVIDAYNRMKSLVSGPINAVGNTFNNVGNALNNAFSGRASGGNVNAGQTYLIGERGPELFTVGSPGFVTPSLAGAGGGSSINITITGNSFMDEYAAEKMGDLILNRLKFKTRI